MFSKIVSQFIFTCSTFLFLSASLFSMERGEGPGEEKKGPVLSTEQKTTISRRSEENIEGDDADPNQGLARSMGGCQLGDPTISGSQEKDQQPSSLQKGNGSGNDGAMSERIFPRGVMSSPPQRTKKEIVTVTPGEETHLGQFGAHNIKEFSPPRSGEPAIVTPSSPKRTSSSPLSARHITFEGSPIKSRRLDEISGRAPVSSISQQEVQGAVGHAATILQHTEEVINSFFPIYDVVDPSDYKKLEELSQSFNDITSAATALRLMKDQLEKLHRPLGTRSQFQQEIVGTSSNHADLSLKLRVATAAIQQTIARAHAVAQALTTDDQYGADIDTALNEARGMKPLTDDLLRQSSMLTQSQSLPVGEPSFTSLEAREDALGQAVDFAKELLEHKNNLIENAADPALTLFGAVNDTQNQDELMQAREKVEAMTIMMGVAIENAQPYLSQWHSVATSVPVVGDRSLPVFDTLRVTREATLQALEEMKAIVSRVNQYHESWPLDVPEILKNIK